MPTGTGKTETMLALLVTGRPDHLLVLVPSDALREQTAAKFVRLGILQELGIVSPTALRPIVGVLQHGLKDAAKAQSFIDACNVVIATPQVLSSSSPEARVALLSACTHLFVDEAHHVAAPSWAAILAEFQDRPVVQFTATPYREDGRRVTGRQVYSYPLRLAQQERYFSHINYHAVIDFEDTDRAVATAALTQLRADLDAGHDHLLMARGESIPRAERLLALYEELAPEFHPVLITYSLGARRRKAALTAIGSRSSRVIVCVNMLGEGFDLPQLKVAAIHDPRKSLGVTLQLIGRFTRTKTDDTLGKASAFVARKDAIADKRLRALYAEDANWNSVIRDLSESAVEEQQETSDFEAGFTSLPDEVNVRTLLPKMSTVVYQAQQDTWEPTELVGYFGEDNLLTIPIGLNLEAGVAWCVVKHVEEVDWGEVRTVEEVHYELFVLYFDSARRLLYINSSENSGVFQDMAELVVGQGASRFTGSTVYKVMGNIERLIPTTVGVLDIHNQFRRFSMHVGSDVSAGFSTGEAQTKTQTNISGSGYGDGEWVNISASLKGRIWSHATARSLRQWCDWCDRIGAKLLDPSISIDDVIGNFLLPQEIDVRPLAVLLGLEWPWDVYLKGPDRLRVSLGGAGSHPLVDADLVPADVSTTGPFRFEVRTPNWSAAYSADYQNSQLVYRSDGQREVQVTTARGQVHLLSSWLNANGLTLLLSDDRIIDQNGLLLNYDRERPPFERARLEAFDWSQADLTTESIGPLNHQDSIQAIAGRYLLEEGTWAIVIDDDGTGEVADLVAMRIDDDALVIRLVHCKRPRGVVPGARVEDLYELCGQACKSVSWRRADMVPFFRYLDKRAREKQGRIGRSPFILGDEQVFYRLQDQAMTKKRRLEIVLVQPGLSAANATTAQLDLLASTESYLRSTINAELIIWGNS
jgi:superfamily II DNA/RNA helicase